MFVNAKEFCRETGFPMRTLVRYIREGKVLCHRVGRSYVLDKERTLEQLDTISVSESPRFRAKKRKPYSMWQVPPDLSFDEEIRLLEKQVKERYYDRNKP